MVHAECWLDEIVDHPQDDACRLRYADWLAEQGDPLGEFIRVQCRLAALPINHLAVPELERREHELLADHEMEWIGDLADVLDWWTFRRGFVEEIGTSADRFLTNACLLFQRAPIQEVHLSFARDHMEALAASPYLQRVTYLDLSNNSIRDYGARLLAESRHLAHLRGLNLSSCGIGDGGLKALIASPHLVELRELYLADNRINNHGIRALAESRSAQQLQIVHLRFNAI